MSLFTLILCQLSLFLLPILASSILTPIPMTAPQTTATSNTALPTVSIWLPWLPNFIHQPILASVINTAPNATTYALSCPAVTDLPNNVVPACIINGPLPQAVTAGPSTVLMSRSASGNFEAWGCTLTGTTTATCEVHSTWTQKSMAGQTQGPGAEVNVTAYAAESIVFRGVTVTAGGIAAANATATSSVAGGSTSMVASSTATATPTGNAAVANGMGHQALWLAVGVGFVELVIGMA